MNRIPVESTNILEIGFDEESSTLEIEFKEGSVYQYFDVPKAIYDQMMNAESKGKYLAAHIKGFYRYVKV